MAITFTAQERLAITRRQIRIDLENEGFQKSSDSFDSQQQALLQVDGSNAKFYDNYDGIVKPYEAEGRFMNGQVADTYSPSDIVTAAQTPNVPPFFPTSPIPPYIRNLPLIQDAAFTNNKVKGYFHPVSTDSRYEQNILTNGTMTAGLTEMLNIFLNGITGATTATTTTQTPLFNIPAGAVSNLKIDVLDESNFAVGELIYIYDSPNISGVYKVASKDTGHLYIDSVIPTAIGFTVMGATIKNTVPGFTNTERQNLTSTNYQEILIAMTVLITGLITEWTTKIVGQQAIVHTDDRSPQNTENATALADVNNTKSIIDAWVALPDTGVNAKWTDNGLSPIQAEITARQTFMTTRLAQILIALGGSSGAALSQSGDTYTTSSPNNPYYNRYKWLNFRINRASGSLRRYYAANQSKGAVEQLKNDNTAIKAEYNGYFITKPVIFNDGSDILHVKNLSGFSNGDTVTIVSETQPEITRTIVQLMGTTQIKLSAPVPTTYKLADTARVFKTL